MRAIRVLAMLMVVVLALGILGLAGCSSSDESSDEGTTEESTDSGDEAASSDSDDPLIGSWENADPTYMPTITFAAGGTGTATDIDGTEADITWTLTDDYLEITVMIEDGTEMTGGGFVWVTEGEEFSWDGDGTYTKVE